MRASSGHPNGTRWYHNATDALRLALGRPLPSRNRHAHDGAHSTATAATGRPRFLLPPGNCRDAFLLQKFALRGAIEIYPASQASHQETTNGSGGCRNGPCGHGGPVPSAVDIELDHDQHSLAISISISSRLRSLPMASAVKHAEHHSADDVADRERRRRSPCQPTR